MKLGTKGRYAVMAMADLAIQSGGKPVALAGIAERQEISLSYLEQLFGKFVMAVDEPLIATRCRPGSATGCLSDKSRCLTHELWEELSNQIHLYLSSVSLSDVINKRILGSSGVLDGPFAVQPKTEPMPTMAPAE